MSPETTQIVIMFVTFVISTTCHEASHALAAKLGGDDTAYQGGQVSLNPLPHIRREPFGLVVLPLLVLLSSNGKLIAGWASAPVDALWAARHPKRSALVSLAGPMANFALSALGGLGLYLLVSSGMDTDEGNYKALWAICSAFFQVNFLLGALNLLPFPPLDGAGVLEGFFPRALSGFFNLLRSQPFIMLAVAYVAMTYGGRAIYPVIHQLADWIATR